MPEVYRKRGSTVRYENGGVVQVREAGEAVEEGPVFRCAPRRDAELLPQLDAAAVLRAADEIRSMIAGGVVVERLIVAEGLAEHEFEGRRWSETSRRLHASLIRGSVRLLIDEGDLDTSDIGPVVLAFARAGVERPSPRRLLLAPRVVAALTPFFLAGPQPEVRIVQIAGGTDGKGQPIAGGALPWRNWYRPSYRVRPQRVPMNITVQTVATAVDASLPQAIALLAPPEGPSLRVLCVQEGEAFPSVITVERLLAVTDRRAWYPFAAGVWAGEAEVAPSSRA